RGLGALAERFGERQEQRDNRDQQRDFLVPALHPVPVTAVRLLLVLDLVIDLMLNCVHAMAHDQSPCPSPKHDGIEPGGIRKEFAAWRGCRRTRVTRADGRRGRPRAAARHRSRCRSAWSTATHARAAPESTAGRRLGPADGWRRSDAARAALQSPAGRARRAASPWRVARYAARADRRARRRTMACRLAACGGMPAHSPR